MRHLFFIIIIQLSINVYSQIPRGGKPYKYSGVKKSSAYQLDIQDKESRIIESLKDAEVISGKKRMKYAFNVDVNLNPENSGEWISLEDKNIWRIKITSRGAKALGLIFDQFVLNDGSAVFLYDPSQKHVLGGFNYLNNKDSGILPTALIPGESIVIELQVPRGAGYGNLNIGSVSHAFVDIFGLDDKKDTGIGASSYCNVDINCDQGISFEMVRRAVCRIQIGVINEFCTGTLINNVKEDGKAYILTANHCISRNSWAQSSVFYFNFDSRYCNADTIFESQTVSSARLLATHDSLDFSLLVLSEEPPESYSPYYAGWTRSEIPSPFATCIHHPWGDMKKISKENNTVETSYQTTNPPDWLYEDRFPQAFWRISRWDLATTEPGSSGAPLLNTDQLIVGNLSGGDANCSNPVNDYFAKIGVDWDFFPDSTKQLAYWLDPNQTDTVMIEGYDPYYNITPDLFDRFWTYPNPASEYVIINIDSLSLRNATVSIYNLQGSMLASKRIKEEKEAVLYLNHLPEGLYILKLQIGDITGRKKIIIER